MKLKLIDYQYFLITITVGLVISGFLYQTENNHQQRAQYETFSQRTKNHFNAIENQLKHSFSSARALHAFFNASTFVNRDEFRIFGQSLLQEHPEIQALEWIPVVAQDEQQDYKKRATEDGVIQFGIHQYDERKQSIKVGNRPYYYPVYYVEPYLGNEKALGYDLGSSKARRNTLSLAVNPNTVVITEPITLVQEKEPEQQAILVILPYFGSTSFEPDSPSQKTQTSITGYVLVVIRMNDFYHYAISSVFHEQGIKVAIIDKETNRYLVGNQESQKQSNYPYQQTLQIMVGGRQWQLIASAPDGFLGDAIHQQANMILIFSVLSSLLLALYVHIINRQNYYINNKVSLKTKALTESRACYKAVIDTAVDAIVSIDSSGHISQFNNSAEQLLGYTAKEVIGKNVSMLMDKDHAPRHDGYLANYLNTGVKKIIGISREVNARHKQGHLIPIHLSVSDTQIKGDKRFTGIIRDLSEINAVKDKIHQHETHLERLVLERTKKLEHANFKLKVLSEIDPLTQIANRRVYEQRLTKEIANAKRSVQPLALMMIDIDYFKPYNDNYGHDAGDSTLKKVAQAISKNLPRQTDLAARFGGEEFVVLMLATDAKGACIVAENIRKTIQLLAIKHEFATIAHVVTVSIGISSLEGDELVSTRLLNQADKALYIAKDKGRNRCQIG